MNNEVNWLLLVIAILVGLLALFVALYRRVSAEKSERSAALIRLMKETMTLNTRVILYEKKIDELTIMKKASDEALGIMQHRCRDLKNKLDIALDRKAVEEHKAIEDMGKS